MEWENAWREASETTSRRVLLRAGIAIGGAGDPASGRLLALARWGLGGRVGSGEQWVSWIALEDFMSVLVGAVVDDTMTGTYSVASPNPVQNTEMMAAYREAAGRSWGLPSPTLVTRIGARLLRSDPALALTGRRVVPSRLLAEGFAFETPDFREAVHRRDRAVGSLIAPRDRSSTLAIRAVLERRKINGDLALADRHPIPIHATRRRPGDVGAGEIVLLAMARVDEGDFGRKRPSDV